MHTCESIHTVEADCEYDIGNDDRQADKLIGDEEILELNALERAGEDVAQCLDQPSMCFVLLISKHDNTEDQQDQREDLR